MRLTGDFFFLDTYNIYCAAVIVKFSAARVCRVLFGVSWCGLWYDWGINERKGDYNGKLHY